MTVHDDRPQEPGGYSYRPYKDDGRYAKVLEQVVKVVGQALGSYEPPYGTALGGIVGGGLGKAAGFGVDNFEAISENIGTVLQEMSDRKSWMTPSPFNDY